MPGAPSHLRRVEAEGRRRGWQPANRADRYAANRRRWLDRMSVGGQPTAVAWLKQTTRPSPHSQVADAFGN